MQIIVVGCGKVGRALIAQLSREDNNVTVIDTNADVVRDVSTLYDIMGVVGNGTSYTVLQEAGLESADMVIALTESDEVNLLTCVIARRKANCHTIARVRNPVYASERHFLRSELQLSMTINPELEAATEISRLLRFPNAIEIDSFAKERIDLLRFKVPEHAFLCGKSLKETSQMYPQNVLVCVVEHNGEVVIPNGDTVIQSGDIITIIVMPGEAEKFFQSIGVKTNRVKNAVIIGGGGISYYLTSILLRQGIDVKIIEKNRKRCEELNEMFPDATVDCGDASDQEMLKEEHLEKMDSLISCTGIDEINAILSLYAQTRIRKKVITKLDHVEFNDVIESLELDSVVNPKTLTVQRILQYVRAAANSMDSDVETLYRIMGGRVEALEFSIHAGSKMTGIKLIDMPIKKGTLIAGILREGKLIIPGGNDSFRELDTVIVVTTNSGYSGIQDILEK